MSSDDEFDIHVPLSDRVQLSRASSSVRSKNSSCKPFKSSRKKNHVKPVSLKYFPGSKDSSSEPWVIPEIPSPYSLGSKKRQNGDKNEQIAKSKRTCLSDRWSRKNNGITDHLSRSQSDGGIGSGCNTVSERKRGAAERSLNICGAGSRRMFNQHSENSVPLSSTDCPSSSLGSSSSTTNDKQLSFPEFSNLKTTFDDVLSQPSTSKFGQQYNEHDNNNPQNQGAKGVRFFDSDDEDSKLSLNGMSLKGGLQSSNFTPSLPKVIGRGCRKILDSDDSSENDWQNEYRRPAKCLSSDSDASSDFPIKPRKKQFSRYSLARLSSTDSNDSNSIGRTLPNSAHSCRNPGRNAIRTSVDAQSIVNRFENAFLGGHLHTSPDVAEDSSLNVSTSNQSQSNHGSSMSALISRGRLYRHKPSSRPPVSPHSRSLNTRRYGLSRLSTGQFSPQERHHCHLASEFPDLFDAEDSSEVEFFTANSYSDTETSGESFREHEHNNSHRQNNATVTVSASSEDEISVIFAGNFMSDISNRSVRSRGSDIRRRRRVRGSGRTSVSNAQEVVSTSPDPVEQVRQVEEDERFARMLQAEFDAEVNETPLCLNSTGSDTDNAVMESIVSHDPGPPGSDGSISSASPVAIRGRAAEPVPLAAHASSFFFPVLHPIRVRGRVRATTGARNTTRRSRRGFPVHHGDPWMWQFARVLGLSPAHSHHHSEQDESDYEALLHIAESVGEVLPRGLRKTEINRLPTRKFYVSGAAGSSSSHTDEVVHKRTDLNKECQVCLCDYENGDILRILPCFHEFHTPCIDPWLKINHTCPVCRVEVTFDE